MESGADHRVTSGRFLDSWPTFDRKGEYLFFASQRDFTAPTYEDVGTTWVYADTDRLYVVPLRKDLPSPLRPKSDEESGADDEGRRRGRRRRGKDDDKDEQEGKDAKTPKREGGRRAAEAGRRSTSTASSSARSCCRWTRGLRHTSRVTDEGKLVYLRRAPLRPRRRRGTIEILDLSKEKERGGPGNGDAATAQARRDEGRARRRRPSLEEVDGFALTRGRQEAARLEGARPMAVVDAAAGAEARRAGARRRHDRAGGAARRVAADLHRGLAPRARLLLRPRHARRRLGGGARASTRRCSTTAPPARTSSYVISEMISELNVGHAYYFGGDVERGPQVSVGMLGCDFELDDGAYRIARIGGRSLGRGRPRSA